MYNAVIDAPFGKVGIRIEGDAVREIVYVPESVPNVAPDSPLAVRTVQQIERYFENPDATFDLPLAEVGTDFQRRVWQAMCEIPRGAVRTYGQLAERLGSTARAVGQACGDNAFPLVIPCHRVVAAKGLGGFSHHAEEGYYLRVKYWLLVHEGVLLL